MKIFKKCAHLPLEILKFLHFFQPYLDLIFSIVSEPIIVEIVLKQIFVDTRKKLQLTKNIRWLRLNRSGNREQDRLRQFSYWRRLRFFFLFIRLSKPLEFRKVQSKRRSVIYDSFRPIGINSLYEDFEVKMIENEKHSHAIMDI